VLAFGGEGSQGMLWGRSGVVGEGVGEDHGGAESGGWAGFTLKDEIVLLAETLRAQSLADSGDAVVESEGFVDVTGYDGELLQAACPGLLERVLADVLPNEI